MHCEMRFTQKNLLQKHLKSHHNVNIYKCDYCPVTFEKHGELREHWKIHFGSKDYDEDVYEVGFNTIEEIVEEDIEDVGMTGYEIILS